MAAQPAAIEGVVLNHVTGRPLAGVHLRFVTFDIGGGGPEQTYGAMSDRAGHFSITGLKPGLYMVFPERAGFVQLPSAHPAMPVGFVPLKPGQQLTDYKIEMTPRASISGRVVDEYGDPVQHISVQLEPVSPNPQIGFGERNSTTDELGEFRLIAAPGRYRLHATQFPFEPEPGREVRTDGTSTEPYAATYYPSTASVGAASILDLAAGQDVAGLEIRLVRGAAAQRHTLTISGVVGGAPDKAVTTIVLRYGESAGELNNSSQTMASLDGKFVFRGLQPGFYRLFAKYSAGKTFLLSQTVDLTLGSTGESAVQLVLAPAETITGTLEITGDAPPAAPRAGHTVRLDGLDALDGDDAEAPRGEVDQEGSFRIASVTPGRFRPVVEPLPENAYIQTVTLNGAAAADNILDLSHGATASHLKITVNPNGAQLSGSVLDKDGNPLVSPLVMIFLATDPKQLHQQDGEDLNRAIGGKYSIHAIRPGKYRVFAVDELALLSTAGDDADRNEEEFMKGLFNSAEEIEIKPGDRIVKDLKAVDKLPDKDPQHAGQKQ